MSSVGRSAASRLLCPVILVVLLAACRGPVQPFESLAPNVANLRAQFNKDDGRVRIVILPAPT